MEMIFWNYLVPIESAPKESIFYYSLNHDVPHLENLGEKTLCAGVAPCAAFLL